MNRGPLLLAALLTAPFAAAQAPTPSPKPPAPPIAILVLTKAPRPLDADVLRQLLQRVYKARLQDKPPKDGRGDWCEVGAASAAIRVQGLLFRLSMGDRPWDLTGVKLLPDDPLQAALQGHRGYFVLQAADADVGKEQREASYRTMGRLAAAMLGEDCVAIGLVEFGAFRPADAEAASELVGADPMRAFAPVQRAGIMVLLKRPRTLDGDALRAAAAVAFGAPFVAPSPKPAANVAGVRGEDALVRWGKVPILVHAVDHKVLDQAALEGHAEAAVAAAIAAHTGALQLVSIDRYVDSAQLQQRYVELCHLLGAMWGEDCLLLSFAGDRRLILATDRTAAVLGSATPLQGLGQTSK